MRSTAALITTFFAYRFAIIPHQRSPARQDDFQMRPGVWHPVNKSNLTVSAVGFFFARRLQQTLHVPVGLIISAWEGSVITTWAPRDGMPDYLNDDKSPGLAFNAKINPMIPFAIKGVVWYQGEENHGMGMKYKGRWGSEFAFAVLRSEWEQRTAPPGN
jgi:Carbohydrate esterase, sialic acid-specific acetylesterase